MSETLDYIARTLKAKHAAFDLLDIEMGRLCSRYCKAEDIGDREEIAIIDKVSLKVERKQILLQEEIEELEGLKSQYQRMISRFRD